MPRISIVVPCLNEASICVRRLEALQHLRRDGHELILVDGGSGDDTVERSRTLVDAVLLSEPGRALQMNMGAEAATGDVLWFLHLDSQIPDEAARLILREVEEGREWGCFEVRLSGNRPMFRVIERMMDLRSRVTCMVTGDQAMFVSCDLFDRVGGFPEIALMEDLAVSKRLKRLSRPVRLPCSVVASSRRWECDGVWRTIALMWFLRTAYHLGADPAWLALQYYPTLRS